jgi:hypothetical protein
MANSGSIGSWTIDSEGIIDTSGFAKIETTRDFSVGGVQQILLGAAATSPSVDTQNGSIVTAAIIKATRNFGNGVNVALSAEASGGIGGGIAGDFIGNVQVSKKLYVGEVATLAGGIKVGASQQAGITTSVLTVNGKTMNFVNGILVSVSG